MASLASLMTPNWGAITRIPAIRLAPVFVDDETGYLRKEVADWCYMNIQPIIEKKTSNPERPLAIYFCTKEDRQRFINQWL